MATILLYRDVGAGPELIRVHTSTYDAHINAGQGWRLADSACADEVSAAHDDLMSTINVGQYEISKLQAAHDDYVRSVQPRLDALTAARDTILAGD